MHIARAALPFLFVTMFAAAASADAAPRCKCTVLGSPAEGAVAGVMLSGGALLLLVSRRRR